MAASLERLDGKVALVTGASHEIGRAIALRLASLGADVIASASGRHPEELAETKRQVEAAGARCHVLAVDLYDDDARARLIDDAAAIFGPIGILINGAGGIVDYAAPSEIGASALRKTFELNYQAPIDLMQAAIPAMRERGWGRILNISSGAAQQKPFPYVGPMQMPNSNVAYGAAKAALDRFTRALAAELYGTGIHVNSVQPDNVPASEGALARGRADASISPEWLEGVELMAEAAAILVSSSFTGQVVRSRDLLAMTQSLVHSVNGEHVVGHAGSGSELA